MTDTGTTFDPPCPGTIEDETGQLFYGQVTFVTNRGLMVVMTEWRKVWYEVMRRYKQVRVMGRWEKIHPPRKMLAAGGRFVAKRPKQITGG